MQWFGCFWQFGSGGCGKTGQSAVEWTKLPSDACGLRANQNKIGRAHV